MARFCGGCGQEAELTQNFCHSCGQELKAVSVPSPAITGETKLNEFDLGDWEAAERALVTDSLNVANIAFRWEGDLLLVPAVREADVDGILDRVERGIPIGDDESRDPTSAPPPTNSIGPGMRPVVVAPSAVGPTKGKNSWIAVLVFIAATIAFVVVRANSGRGDKSAHGPYSPTVESAILAGCNSEAPGQRDYCLCALHGVEARFTETEFNAIESRYLSGVPYPPEVVAVANSCAGSVVETTTKRTIDAPAVASLQAYLDESSHDHFALSPALAATKDNSFAGESLCIPITVTNNGKRDAPFI